MPEQIGGKKFVTDFQSMIKQEVAKALDEGRSIIREATSDLKKAITDQSKGAARVIREEAQHIRDGFADYVGNNPPDEEIAAEEAAKQGGTDGKSDPTRSQSEGGTGS